MKKRILFGFLKTTVRVILGGMAGFLTGVLLYLTILPLWKVIPLGVAPNDAINILFVDFYFWDLSQVDKNMVYVQSVQGDIYVGFENHWQSLPPLPNGLSITQIRPGQTHKQGAIRAIANHGEVFELIDGQWKVPENFVEQPPGIIPYECVKLWHIPIFNEVDSAGFLFDHALASEHICYVLIKDGQMKVLTRENDVFSMMGAWVVFVLIGMVLGFKSPSIVNSFSRRKSISR